MTCFLFKFREFINHVYYFRLERWVTVAPETFGCPGQPSAELPEILTAKVSI